MYDHPVRRCWQNQKRHAYKVLAEKKKMMGCRIGGAPVPKSSFSVPKYSRVHFFLYIVLPVPPCIYSWSWTFILYHELCSNSDNISHILLNYPAVAHISMVRSSIDFLPRHTLLVGVGRQLTCAIKKMIGAMPRLAQPIVSISSAVL